MAQISQYQEMQKPALRGLVNAVLKDRAKAPKIADRFLPNDNIDSSTFAYDIVKKSTHIAAMIGYGAEPPVVDRDAVAQVAGEVAKLGLKYIATEEELLAIASARSNDSKRAAIDKLITKGVDLIDAILLRVDVMKLEALTKGTFTYNKNAVKIDIDFGVPAANKVTSDWTIPDHDVIGDLLDWIKKFQDANGGQSPAEIWLSRDIQRLLLKNAVIVSEVGRPVNGAGRVNAEELTKVLGAYGIPPIRVVTNRSVTVKDIYSGEEETIEFMPINRVVMLGEGIGNFLFGPTVENDYKPGIVLDAYDKIEPIQSVMRAVAAGFPAIDTPSLIFYADVM
ncbi:major capsid protein E [Paenibacillus sp. LC231]|uniref:major capsid protein n=1 Tax=Paenibacillus sp. LC231 TaxID=1120679 RepID=UPI0008DE8885|nr:major capsid protein [Paenibacillus sp. LC231]OIB03502.1 major capsid protein E [Paenibacillus sp. LC231]